MFYFPLQIMGNMKKALCMCLVTLCLLLFTACDLQEMSSLKDISRPYEGEYQCETLTLDGEEMIDRFEYIRLSLEEDKFTLRARDEHGLNYSYQGNYRYDDNRFTFTGKFGIRELSREFPYKNGVLFLDLPFGGKLLHAEFSL